MGGRASTLCGSESESLRQVIDNGLKGTGSRTASSPCYGIRRNAFYSGLLMTLLMVTTMMNAYLLWCSYCVLSFPNLVIILVPVHLHSFPPHPPSCISHSHEPGLAVYLSVPHLPRFLNHSPQSISFSKASSLCHPSSKSDTCYSSSGPLPNHTFDSSISTSSFRNSHGMPSLTPLHLRLCLPCPRAK